MDCSTPGFPVLHDLPEFAQTHVHWFSDAIQPSQPLSPPSLPALNLSQHQGFSNELALHIRWSKYWSFSFSSSPSNEYSRLICFRMDWFHFLAVQGTLKSLLQHHHSKASVLQHSAFFTVKLSHPHMTTGKNRTFDYMDFCQQSGILLFNMLSRLVIACLPRSKCLLIPWLQSSSRDFGAQENSLSLFPHLFAMKWGDRMPWCSFSECWVLSQQTLLYHLHHEAL